MRRTLVFPCLVAMALAVTGCGVRLRDETPARFKANPDIGMYPLTVKVTAVGALVTQPVYVFAVSDGKRVPLTAGPDGTYRTMFPVTCRRAFALQFLALWRLQGMLTRHALFPAEPRQIELTPPALTRQTSIDTSGKPDGKTRTWRGSVRYEFITAPEAHITGAHLEPSSQSRADVAAARAISITSALPIDALCGTPTAVELASRDRRAHANLVIDTDLSDFPHWTTRVEFAPH